MVILKQDISEKQAMFYLLAYSFLRKNLLIIRLHN